MRPDGHTATPYLLATTGTKDEHRHAEMELQCRLKVIGGAKGSRTPDLLNAIQALSQLSYGPTPGPRRRRSPGEEVDLNFRSGQ